MRLAAGHSGEASSARPDRLESWSIESAGQYGRPLSLASRPGGRVRLAALRIWSPSLRVALNANDENVPAVLSVEPASKVGRTAGWRRGTDLRPAPSRW